MSLATELGQNGKTVVSAAVANQVQAFVWVSHQGHDRAIGDSEGCAPALKAEPSAGNHLCGAWHGFGCVHIYDKSIGQVVNLAE